MYNRLLADPEIRSRYQFWFFQDDSGNPIALSALRLREALAGAVARRGPEGKDPALRRMVLVGHSQGGLLVKMQRSAALQRQRARGLRRGTEGRTEDRVRRRPHRPTPMEA
jgi:hypothetical protein